MIVLIILSALFLGSLIFAIKTDWANGWFFGGVATFGSLLFCLLITFPIVYYDTNENLAKFNATKSTVASFRMNDDNYEKAALQMKVIESNQWLAQAQYYRHTIWAIYIPKVVDNIQPIK